MMKVDLTKFETIIFDFGGVILDIDPERTRKSFIKLVGDRAVEKIYDSGLLREYEQGIITTSEVYQKFNEITGENIVPDIFNRAWCAMLIDYKHKRIERIQYLKRSHNLLMLSNTNEIHFNFFSQKLKHEYGVTFDDLFRKVYLSNKMKLLKPDPEIYRRVLIEEQLNPETTLFIEDTPENAHAAEKLGIETLVIPRNGNFYDYFL